MRDVRNGRFFDFIGRAGRDALDACADCDCCRPPMDPDCGVFKALFRLHDREKETGDPIRPAEYRALVDLCNFCALCPCPDIRDGLIEAKIRFVQRDGLSPRVRLLADVARLGRICGAAPRWLNAALQARCTGGAIRRAIGVHRRRSFPTLPDSAFDGSRPFPTSGETPASATDRRIAYFAGCTGRYFFPDVPKAATSVLSRFGVSVVFPPQQCCGMPTLLEGDADGAIEQAAQNLAHLSALIDEGFDVVCSCPTCGYMLTSVICKGARYSDAYQRSIGAPPSQLKIPDREGGYSILSRTIYGSLLKDEGHFSAIDPLQRVKVARHTYDLGEYLAGLAASADLPGLGPLPTTAVYFPPCHQRKQQIGRPWQQLLEKVPALSLEVIDGSFYCCGMGGIMGFKEDFFSASLQQGRPLFEAIDSLSPERIVTECLSCRLQFDQALGLPVYHPVEILAEALLARHNEDPAPSPRPPSPSL